MKKIVLGLMPLVIGSMLLAGCTAKKGEEESSEPEVSYTAEQVAADMNANLEAAGYGTLALEFDEEHNEWGTGANAGASTDESEANLKGGADILASYLPEYMGEPLEWYGDPTAEGYINVFGDNSIYYAEVFMSPDEAVEADVFSYIYSGKLCFQISIYDAAEE